MRIIVCLALLCVPAFGGRNPNAFAERYYRITFTTGTDYTGEYREGDGEWQTDPKVERRQRTIFFRQPKALFDEALAAARRLQGTKSTSMLTCVQDHRNAHGVP